MTTKKKAASAESLQVRPKCVAVNVCGDETTPYRCEADATEGHFCWTHARAVEAAAAKRREPVKVVPLQTAQEASK